MAKSAYEVAASAGIHCGLLPQHILMGARVGIKARLGQYVKDGVCMAEFINAARSRYTPHQGKRECGRRVSHAA